VATIESFAEGLMEVAESSSRIILYTVAAFIALAGLAAATYLTVQYLTGQTVACGGSASCFQVLGSVYARIAGIPVAAFGVVGLFQRVQFRDVRGLRLRAGPQVFYFDRVGNVGCHPMAAICAGVHSACILSLLFILGSARLRPRGRGSPYPFFPLIGSRASTIRSTNTSESEKVVHGSLLM